ncbi:unnamed protein product [Diabrotica balteata]|uniref:Glycoside hydrolase family 31 n=1 Tax=Diabrotica balteata TaxID=107213 RepID=A0A9N9SPI0_DIABA|nr:unnamed protein product [Diabrotica balteata]
MLLLLKTICLVMEFAFISSRAILIVILLVGVNRVQCSTVNEIILKPSSNGLAIEVNQKEEKKLKGTLGVGIDFTNINCYGQESCQVGDADFSVKQSDDRFYIKWETKNLTSVFQDCFDFEEGVHWYGGPERKKQSWPIEKLEIESYQAYVLHQLDNFAVAERYWLNSKGLYIYLNSKVPLYVDQNISNKNRVCFIAKLEGPFIKRHKNFLEYDIVIKDDPREAHQHAVQTFLGKPSGYPDERMVTEPIWTTWAKYKTKINDEIVLSFAKDIRDNGYEKGQIEIDDYWEKCYGAQEFTPTTFPDIVNTIKTLKSWNYRVTLWIHPFVNSDCQNNSNIGIEKGYFVLDQNGRADGSWWNGNDSYQIDFTNPEAAEWWSARLKKLQQNPGIDSFKFDAGETDYGPQPSVYHGVNQEDVPNILSESYVRTCAKFGPLVEVRSGSRTQDLPIFIRMIDKDSNWGDSNGLYTLITTLLQMNINGYTLVLPDMIGGNGYAGKLPDAELLVRWTQANTFMPAMQFSYLPWEITSTKFNVAKIVKKFVTLHEKYADHIIRAMKNSVEKGTPVNPPIWWIAPKDLKALACDDEYLVGEEILVAPVIKKGATRRDVYLPAGKWVDGNNGDIYQGPLTVDYDAGIDILPFFILSQ